MSYDVQAALWFALAFGVPIGTIVFILIAMRKT